MSRTKHDFVALSDIAAGIGLLSRLPVVLNTERAQARGAQAAWAWPLAGALIGTIAALVGSLSLWVGLAPSLAAALSLACLVIVTGAMHEDGLADCADGLWGGWDKARRLQIMKDSHIGVYGVLAVGLSLILRWQAMTLLLDHGLVWAALIGVASLSRAPMVAMMAAMPPARGNGLSRNVGQPTPTVAAIAAILALVMAALTLGSTSLIAIACVVTVGLGWAAICRSKIGGQTGDTLGALQQLGEISALLVLSASLT